MIADVQRQLGRVPAGASHLVVSAGGNDALRDSDVLDQAASSVWDALDKLGVVRTRFRDGYRAMLDEVLERRLPTGVCTIYEPRFPDPLRRRIAATALCLLNDVITREAAARGLPVLDLRVLFDEDADFANPIEPSAAGGNKLAGAVLEFVAAEVSSELSGSCLFIGNPT